MRAGQSSDPSRVVVVVVVSWLVVVVVSRLRRLELRPNPEGVNEICPSAYQQAV